MDIKEFIEKFAEAIEVEEVENLSGLIAFYDEEFEKEIGDKDIKACTTIEELYQLTTA